MGDDYSGNADSNEGKSVARRVKWLKERLGIAFDLVAEGISEFRRYENECKSRSRFLLDPGGRTLEGDQDIVLRGSHESKEIVLTPVKTSESTASWWSWGLTERTITVEAPRPFSSAGLRVRLLNAEHKFLAAKSIMMARWEPGACEFGRFLPIPASGYNAAENYVFAEITRNGIYTVIGVPCELRILALLQMLLPIFRLSAETEPSIKEVVRPIASELMSSLGHLFRDSLIIRSPPSSQSHVLSTLFEAGETTLAASSTAEVIVAAVSRMPEVSLLNGIAEPHRLLADPDSFPNIWPDKPFAPRFHGPDDFAGRITVVVCHPDDAKRWYVATAGGGVWKTTDAGESWHPTMDDGSVDCLAIGGIDISRTNPDVLYAATGEWTGGTGQHVSIVAQGTGVFKTVNGGCNWTKCADLPLKYSSVVRVDVCDSEHVFVGGDTGLFESIDGGDSWTHIEPPEERACEVSDLVVDPLNPGTIIAAFDRWGVARRNFGSGAWEKLIVNIAPCIAPKLAIQPTEHIDDDRILVKVKGFVQRYNEKCKVFEKFEENLRWGHDDPAMFSWASMIAAHPTRRDVVLTGDLDCFLWNPEGRTGEKWERLLEFAGEPEFGFDQQCLIFLPPDFDRFLVANDRGLYLGVLEQSGESQATKRTGSRSSVGYVSKSLCAMHTYTVAGTGDSSLGGTLQDGDARVKRGRKWSSLLAGEHGFLMADPTRPQLFLHSTPASGEMKWYLFDADEIVQCGSFTGSNPDWTISEPLAIGRNGLDGMLAVHVVHSDGTGWPDANEIRKFCVDQEEGNTAFPQGEWRTVQDPLREGRFSAIAFAPSTDRVAIAADTHGGVRISKARATDRTAGSTWIGVKSIDARAAPCSIKTMAIDWYCSSRIYVTGHDREGNLTALRGDITETSCGCYSVNWTKLVDGKAFSGLRRLPILALVPHPGLEGTLFAGTASGLLHTRFAGQHWETAAGVPKVALLDLDLASSRGGGGAQLYCASMGRGIITIAL